MAEHVINLPEQDYTKYTEKEKFRIRIAVSLFYFCQGLAFASWASRIPDIKTTLNLSDALLGTLLLALPIGQLMTMPISGKLVTQYGSQKILRFTAPLYAIILIGIGLSTSAIMLGFMLFLFGIVGNMCNISVNTQGVAVEKIYNKSIMTSFHGAWSIAGFTGALIGLIMMNLHIQPAYHFCFILLLVLISTVVNLKYLVHAKGQRKEKSSIFTKPDTILIQLGIIGFCSMAAEGAMFDWSGVYFKEIVHAPQSLIILGYASFMVMMALARFVGDWAIRRMGRRNLLMLSGVLIFIGMMTSVLFPFLWSATLGFMCVGLGVACIVPSAYSIAGQHPTIPAGVALALVSSVSYLGFLMGPPLIGYISELSNLRYSYAVIGLFGLLVIFIVAKASVIKNKEEA